MIVLSLVLAAQEVSRSGFTDDLQPALLERGYEGLFKQRTKDEHMDDPAMDGCVIFFNTRRFKLRKAYDVEFSQLAQSDISISSSSACLNHFYKHNVAQIVFLEVLSLDERRHLEVKSCCVLFSCGHC